MRLLELDPELGSGLGTDSLASARELAIVPAFRIDRGGWDPAAARLHPALQNEPLCMIVGRGLLLCRTALDERPAAAIAGPGDIVPLVRSEDEEQTLAARRTITVAEQAVIGVLDAGFIALAHRWPPLVAEILRRVSEQLRRAAVEQAISQLSRTEDRVLALAWHLAGRFGTVGRQGVTLGMRLTHDTIGAMVGAERPTVTLAIRKLERAGLLQRRTGGMIMLSHASAKRFLVDDGARTGAPRLNVNVSPPRPAELVLEEHTTVDPPLTGDGAAIRVRALLAREIAFRVTQHSQRLCARAETVRLRTNTVNGAAHALTDAKPG